MGRQEWPATRLGLVGLLLTGVSGLLGGAYFAYLQRVPFPPDGARLAPAIWLLGALVGLVFLLRSSWRGARGRRLLTAILAGGGSALAVPNIALAALFLFAALMGD